MGFGGDASGVLLLGLGACHVWRRDFENIRDRVACCSMAELGVLKEFEGQLEPGTHHHRQCQ